MPGPVAKDAKTLSEATHKAGEQHGDARDQTRTEVLALKPLAWANDLYVNELEKIKTTTKDSRSYRNHTNQSEEYQSL